MSSLEQLDWPLRYAARGWRVFPVHAARGAGCTCRNTDCTNPGKHPVVAHGLKEATSDERTLESWWRRWPWANIAIATGAASDLVVIDIDPDHGGVESLEIVEAEHGPLPPTLKARTGGGGWHLLFHYPGQRTPNTAGRLPGHEAPAPGIDLRGDGGYIVAAPSVHRSGRLYEWANTIDLAYFPSWIRTPEPPPRADVIPFRRADGHGTPYGLEAMRRECDEVASAPSGRRNHALNAAAFALGQLVAGGELDENAAQAHLEEAAAACGLDGTEVRRTIRSGFTSGLETPRQAPPRPPSTSPPRHEAPWPDDEPPDLDDEPEHIVHQAEDGPITAPIADGDPKRRSGIIDGATFLLDPPPEVPALWGDGERVLWARGESLLVCGPTGIGKTTLVQQLILAALGVRGELLGLPVVALDDRILYIAADRPSQAARSMRRMVGEPHRDLLRELLVFWRGPLTFDLAKEPFKLAQLAIEQACRVIVVDSLKDIAPDLSKDETGSRVNIAVQICLAAGIDIIALHHLRKGVGGQAHKPKNVDEIYGSTWLTAGAGSVLSLWGEPGDLIVELSHLKQPAETLGPWQIEHDHKTGTSVRTDNEPDLYDLIRSAGIKGVAAQDLARRIDGADKPSHNAVAKVRRRLQTLEEKGLIVEIGGDKSRHNPGRWYLKTDRAE